MMILAVVMSFIFIALAGAQDMAGMVSKVAQGGVLVIRTNPGQTVSSCSRTFFIGTERVVQDEIARVALKPGTILEFGGSRFELNNHGEAYIGIALDVEPGNYAVSVEEGNLSCLFRFVDVVAKEYPIRRRGTFTPSKRWKEERQIIAQAFNGGSYAERFFAGQFIAPIDSVAVDANRTIGGISSPFGEGHGGVDLITLDTRNGRHNRPVKATNAGRVALAVPRFSTEGNLVILDHGSGIFSVYMHLASFSIKQGQTVQAGQVIGRSGRSGSARGPHLHFAVKVRNRDGDNDVYVDPLAFIETMNVGVP